MAGLTLAAAEATVTLGAVDKITHLTINFSPSSQVSLDTFKALTSLTVHADSTVLFAADTAAAGTIDFGGTTDGSLKASSITHLTLQGSAALDLSIFKGITELAYATAPSSLHADVIGATGDNAKVGSLEKLSILSSGSICAVPTLTDVKLTHLVLDCEGGASALGFPANSKGTAKTDTKAKKEGSLQHVEIGDSVRSVGSALSELLSLANLSLGERVNEVPVLHADVKGTAKTADAAAIPGTLKTLTVKSTVFGTASLIVRLENMILGERVCDLRFLSIIGAVGSLELQDSCFSVMQNSALTSMKYNASSFSKGGGGGSSGEAKECEGGNSTVLIVVIAVGVVALLALGGLLAKTSAAPKQAAVAPAVAPLGDSSGGEKKVRKKSSKSRKAKKTNE
jgi:hypothetical protein